MTAGMEARKTAAAAAAGFDREVDAYIAGTGDRPDFESWAWRLRTSLLILLAAGSDR